MYNNMTYLVALEIHKERQQEITNQLRLDELLADHRAQRRETMKRLLGLLRPIAAMHLMSFQIQRKLLRGV